MAVSKIIASCFGIGYIQKGAGSLAALFCCLFWVLLNGGDGQWWFQAMLLILVFFAGVFASSQVEKEWGHDSSRVVVDEVFGMLTTLFLVPSNWLYVLLGFVLFRFFDIAKPLGVKKMELLPSGWGVMLDDALAALYSNVLLQIAVKGHFFT